MDSIDLDIKNILKIDSPSEQTKLVGSFIISNARLRIQKALINNELSVDDGLAIISSFKQYEKLYEAFIDTAYALNDSSNKQLDSSKKIALLEKEVSKLTRKLAKYEKLIKENKKIK